MKETKEKPVIACYLCDFIRAPSFGRFKAMVGFALMAVWKSKIAKILLLVGGVLALLTSVLLSASKAGCLLVAYAIAIAGLHNFWISSVEHYSRKANAKNADIEYKINDLLNDIAKMNLTGVELLIGFIGTLLWGFGSST